jgi:hypothetical protein|tara:strand:+ start:494 stop:1555 length:1062 start_codon:yes stop_codon:yes gene_type:complete
MGFKRFDPEDFVVSADTVTSTVWSGFQPTLNTYFTSSVQKEGTSGPYYLNVFQTSSVAAGSEIQFAIAFGDKTGRGAVQFDSGVPQLTPSRVNYGQYRTLVLEDENADFVYGLNFSGSYFYALNVERARYKESLFPGTFNLVLSSSNNQLNSIQLTDNSNEVTIPQFFGTMRAYQVISGSFGTAWRGNGNSYSGSYGLFLPDISTILLNGSALDDDSTPGTTGQNDGGGINLKTTLTNDFNGDNSTKLYNHISGSSGDGNGRIFQLNSQETITSDFVFVRTRNSEFNYSENPSFISGSTGEVIYNYFIDNPQTFPTSVGMYNDANELLAVAKLSKPITKDFTKEALIRIKLDF